MNNRRKKRRANKVLGVLLILSVLFLLGFILKNPLFPNEKETQVSEISVPDWIDKQIIRLGGSSRSGKSLKTVNDIVIHYVGNPGTTAQANRDYFNSTSSTVSSHFVVGLQGEIIQCVPLHERSAASNHRNRDTISIEVCHADDTGKFSSDSYASLVRLTAWLLAEYDLSTDHIIRHYDVTGKECPRYFVTHPDAWETFKKDVQEYIE